MDEKVVIFHSHKQFQSQKAKNTHKLQHFLLDILSFGIVAIYLLLPQRSIGRLKVFTQLLTLQFTLQFVTQNLGTICDYQQVKHNKQKSYEFMIVCWSLRMFLTNFSRSLVFSLFLKFCTKIEINEREKVREVDFLEKSLFSGKWAEINPKWVQS